MLEFDNPTKSPPKVRTPLVTSWRISWIYCPPSFLNIKNRMLEKPLQENAAVFLVTWVQNYHTSYWAAYVPGVAEITAMVFIYLSCTLQSFVNQVVFHNKNCLRILRILESADKEFKTNILVLLLVKS